MWLLRRERKKSLELALKPEHSHLLDAMQKADYTIESSMVSTKATLDIYERRSSYLKESRAHIVGYDDLMPVLREYQEAKLRITSIKFDKLLVLVFSDRKISYTLGVLKIDLHELDEDSGVRNHFPSL